MSFLVVVGTMVVR